MKTAAKNIFVDCTDTWVSDAKEGPGTTRDLPMQLDRVIEYFAEIETNCDDLIQEQDWLIREVTHRVSKASGASLSGETLHPISTNQNAGSMVSASNLPFEQYRQVAGLANRVIENQMPMATQQFIQQAGKEDVARIEELEDEIGILRQRMRDVEHQILDYTPETPEHVVLKLRFMSLLMIDGGEIDVDFFAYLVEECATVMDVLISKSHPV
ncbi:MAG: hypothetical protein ACT4OK_01925 [Gemmobacter sp.]